VKLDRPTVIDAGATVARASGITAVGVRAVAAELGVTPMALYRHVADAADLHAAVVDLALAGLPDVPDAGPWDDRCRWWAHETRAVFVAFPGLAHHVLLDWTRLPPLLRSVERLSTMLADEGPAGTDVVAGANAVFTYVLARSEAEEAVREGGLERELAVLAAMADEVPFLWANRRELAVARVDEHFAFGLDALLAGIPAARR
jgi:AcrR family transcriptional regulator